MFFLCVCVCVQARFAQSLEEVIRAVVADAGDLSRTQHQHADQLAAHTRHIDDTREAIVRCSAVFSALLGVPSPVPAALAASRTSAAAVPGPGPGANVGPGQGLATATVPVTGTAGDARKHGIQKGSAQVPTHAAAVFTGLSLPSSLASTPRLT